MIHAAYAPLVKVYASPQAAQSAITSQAEETTPTSSQAVPVPRNPMINDSRRL